MRKPPISLFIFFYFKSQIYLFILVFAFSERLLANSNRLEKKFILMLLHFGDKIH